MESSEKSSNYFSQANAAFVAEEYLEAAELYSKAITVDDQNPDFYINRSHTLQKLEKYIEAKGDADKAIKLNSSEPKAYLRKGVACFHLGEYQEAKEAFQKGVEVGGSDVGMRQWIAWTEEKMKKLNMKEGGISSNLQSEAATPEPVQVTSPPSVRHDWYQTESHVCVTILAKNLDPREVQVKLAANNVTVDAKLPDGRDYHLPLQLSYPIVPEQSTFSVLKTKVEIKMKKCDGIRWTQLEGPVAAEVKQIQVTSAANPPGPVYPSSAPKKRDWDKIEVEIKKEEAEEKPEGEAALNQLFQKIYAEGSDEIRRAMNKSFQESGGTVLSTNWNEVAKEKLTVKPPDGMEFKRWDQ